MGSPATEGCVAADMGAPPITSTDTITFKRSRFAGHAAPVACEADVDALVAALAAPQTCVPRAFRLAGAAEGCNDGGDVGVGAKLLHRAPRGLMTAPRRRRGDAAVTPRRRCGDAAMTPR